MNRKGVITFLVHDQEATVAELPLNAFGIDHQPTTCQGELIGDGGLNACFVVIEAASGFRVLKRFFAACAVYDDSLAGRVGVLGGCFGGCHRVGGGLGGGGCGGFFGGGRGGAGGDEAAGQGENDQNCNYGNEVFFVFHGFLLKN